jgi:hypothetical protein
MSSFRYFVTLLTVLLAAGCHRKEDPCLSNCQLRAKELGCAHADQCGATCEKVKQAKNCAKPMEAFMQCAYKQPKARYQCSEDGVPVVGDEICEAERGDMFICLQRFQGQL